MKRKIGFLIGLVVLVAIIIFGMKFLNNRSPKQGKLKVNSSPASGVFLGTANIGRTPYEEMTNSGEYTIKLVPESTVTALSSWQGNIKIQPNLLTYVNADLAESEFTTAVDILWLEKISNKQSEISVTTNPDGASVSLDGETKGVTPLPMPNITTGEHSLIVSSPGFLTRTLKVKTTAGYRLNAIIKLALSPQGISEATTSASPTPSSSITPKPTVTGTATASASPNPPKPYALIKDTPTGFLRVRMEPTTGATEAAQVKPGDKFTILDTQDGWFKISYDGKNTGWISAQYTEKVE